VNLDDGGTYHLSRTQHELWRAWLDFCQECAALPGRKVVLINGDMGELDTKRRSVQLITANKATILHTVSDTLAPIFDLADRVIVTRGTQAHVGKGAWLEEVIAADLDHIVKDKTKKTSSWYHIRTTIDGKHIDASHHASMSGMPWGKGNSANNLAHKITWAYMVDMHQPPPDLALRSHNHRLARSEGFPVEVQYTPAWTSATEFVYRQGYENTLADIGGLIYTIEAGQMSKREIIFKPAEMKRIWKLTI
jgi:hypothetical protein